MAVAGPASFDGLHIEIGELRPASDVAVSYTHNPFLVVCRLQYGEYGSEEGASRPLLLSVDTLNGLVF
jgi:hypothetical protein